MSTTMFVCLCKAVTNRDIENAIDSGVSSFDAMQDRLEVATVCGSCTCEVKQMLMDKFNKNLSAKHSLACAKTVPVQI